MKVIVVYTSIAHGNTEKVARTMAEAMGADLVKTAEASPGFLGSYDLLGFGSGIYHGKQHHQDIFDLVARLPASPGKRAFVFSTSGYGTSKPNEKLVKELERKGFKVVGNFACKGFNTAGITKLFGGSAKGRPNDNDLQEAKAFAKSLTS